MIKCDPRVFSRCKYHSQCEGDAYYREGSECEKFAKAILDCPMTNADRLRSMSDEELAKWMAEQAGKGPSDDPTVWLDWMKKPMEE